MRLSRAISWLKGTLQRCLFPDLEECWNTTLTDKERQLVSILEIVEVESFVVRKADNQCLGRKLLERESIARSFVAKAVYAYPTTRALMEALKTTPNVRRICGFRSDADIPCEATFSRAFAEFSDTCLGDRVHDSMVERCLKTELIGHISRDATAIQGREKPVRKLPKERLAPRKRGRPAKGEQREPKEPTRLERQLHQSAEEALSELPVFCDCGSKKNSKGFKETWIGYKLHADVNDCGLPVSVVLTAASVHDCQVAIPLMKMSSGKVDYLYCPVPEIRWLISDLYGIVFPSCDGVAQGRYGTTQEAGNHSF